MRPRLVTAVLAATLVTLPAPARAQSAPGDTLPVDPAVTMGVLENGLRYYVRANDRPEERAELRLVLNVGSILEDEGQRGLAHLLEHMAFNGTESFEKQELVEYLESVGMEFGPSVNASTSFDETIYMLQVPTDDPEVLATGLQILEEWAHAITLDPAEVDQERQVVIEEWRLGRGAAARIAEQQLPVIFQGSRYAERLPIGDPEVLESFPHEEIVRFYREWYRPDLMAVVAVGDFDPEAVEEAIRTRFSTIPAPADPTERPLYPVPDHDGTRVSIATDPEATGSQVVMVRLQDPAPTGTVADYRRSLVESLANTMLNERLREIAQQADAPFLGAGGGRARFVRTKSAYQLGAAVSQEGHVEGLEAVLTEAERAARFGFTATELERAKANVTRSLERALAEKDNQPSGRFAGEYVAHFLRDEAIPSIEARSTLGLELVPGITVDEVNAVARDNLDGTSRALLVTGIEDPEIRMPTEADLLAAFQEAETAELTAYEEEAVSRTLVSDPPAPGSVVSEEVVDSVGLTIWELSNGATVWIKPTDFKDDEVLVRATSPGGWSNSSLENHTSATFAATAVQLSGVGDFSQVELRRALAGKAVSLSPFVSETREGLQGQASPRDLESLFELIWLHFTAPRRDPETFQAFLGQARAGLANRDADPGSAFADTLSVTLAGHHPRAEPPTPEMLDELELDTAVEFYEERFASANDFTFVFVGAAEPEELRPLVERYLAALPGEARDDGWVDLEMDPPAGRVEKVVRKGIEPQSRTAMVFTGAFDPTFQNRFDLRVLAGVLETRLRERLREELGGTYSVGVSGSYERVPDPRYQIRIQFGSDPERAQELQDAVFTEIEELRQEGPAAEDVASVLETERRSRETALEQNGWWASRLQQAAAYGTDPRKLLDDTRPEEVSVETVRADARSYLDPENVVIVVLKPESPEG